MCNRPFDNIDDMNKTIIDRWNQKVHKNDHVYILGDMFFRCEDPEAILRVLKGKKHLIVSNHYGWAKRAELQKYFVSIDNYLEFSDGQNYLILSHYPMLSYHRESRENTYMIHGHIHADTNADFFPLLAKRERILNAGVDLNEYAPVTLEELLLNNKGRKKLYNLTRKDQLLEKINFVAENKETGEQTLFHLPRDITLLQKHIDFIKDDIDNEIGVYKSQNNLTFKLLTEPETPFEDWKFIVEDWLKLEDYVELIKKHPYIRIKKEVFNAAKEKAENNLPF